MTDAIVSVERNAIVATTNNTIILKVVCRVMLVVDCGLLVCCWFFVGLMYRRRTT